MDISKRTLVKTVSLSLAAIITLGVKSGIYYSRTAAAEQALNYSYYRAIEDLSQSADSISTTLEKELYAGSPTMYSKLSAQLLNQASSAKASLSQLPIEKLGLENTYKFLSQVGDFSQAMGAKLARGEELSDKEYKNLQSLFEYSSSLRDAMWELEGKAQRGDLTLYSSDNENLEKLGDANGFKDFENSFDNYPKLIYDGPFSDNIMEKEPLMLKGKAEVSQDKALEKCILTLGISTKDVPNISEEYGKMPSYRFYDDNGYLDCAVTKQGGIVSYFLKNKRVNYCDITNEEALSYAGDYLESIGITDMESTYYEVYDNVCTINFAYLDGKVLMYTDLIKVQVSMADGEIVGYDARGYIVNHRKRTLPGGVISAKRASEEVSPVLEIKGTRLCYIPTDGKNEVLCHEFSCVSRSGREVLVYINALTAHEENILMLTTTESGTLTV